MGSSIQMQGFVLAENLESTSVITGEIAENMDKLAGGSEDVVAAAPRIYLLIVHNSSVYSSKHTHIHIHTQTRGNDTCPSTGVLLMPLVMFSSKAVDSQVFI